MKSRMTKFTAAAVIIVAILVALDYPGLQVRLTTPVFGDMIEQISKAHSVMYQQTTYTEGRELPATRHMVNELGVTRYLNQYGAVAIYDRRSGKELRLNPKSKTGMMLYKVGRDKGKGVINYLDWLANLHEKSGRFEGQEEIDGRTANVFVVEQDFRASIRKRTIWVDAETDLPVRVELVDMPDPDEGIIVPEMSLDLKDFGGEENDVRTIRISGDGVQSKRTIVWSDFVWDPDLDESLFSVEPPEGYSVEEITFDVSDKGENGLIDALAFWTQMSGGLFPSRIVDLGDANKVTPMLIEKYDRDGDPKEEFEQAMEQMNTLLQGLWFAQKCRVQGSWHYSGANVRLGDADKPICWWKPEDSDSCRVIYGDLSIGDSPVMPQAPQNE
ncbi:MAG: LolA-like protein [Planctomycetota bacterium]